MELLDLYGQKKEALKEIHDLTLQIKSAVEQEEYNQLECILEKRQIVMNKINDIDTELQGLESENSAHVIHMVKNEIQDILKETIKLDEQLKTRLGEDMISLKQKIKNLQGNKNMKQVYYPQQRQNSGYFVDRKK